METLDARNLEKSQTDRKSHASSTMYQSFKEERNSVLSRKSVKVFQVQDRNPSVKQMDANLRPIPMRERALLEWKNLSYYVPVNKKVIDQPQQQRQADNVKQSRIDSSQMMDESRSQLIGSGLEVNKTNFSSNLVKEQQTAMPQPNYVSRGGKLFKEVVCKSNGYLMPGEMVAVLGPSGCGKTSLLNNLSQRTSLSGGSFNSGLIKINGKALSAGDFGKIGAFVQQDDVLVSTNTVKESFEFACRLTNRHLSQPQMDKKVDTMIKCLGLQACKDTLIGGFMIKSISGGERKRTSIGYELITDPSILLLDEPTSGLDSSTSLRIIRILREQAKERGMAIMATIHQPSSDVLFCFDRVIIMSDGYQIYSGPPDQMNEFFSPFGYKKPRFCNPADQLSTIASMPSKLLYPQTTILQLATHVNEVQTHKKPFI